MWSPAHTAHTGEGTPFLQEESGALKQWHDVT